MQTPMHELEPVLQTPEKREKEVRKVRRFSGAQCRWHWGAYISLPDPRAVSQHTRKRKGDWRR